MSQTDEGHNRFPPKERTNPDYPEGLEANRYDHTECAGADVIYDSQNHNAWVCGQAFYVEDMV